MTLMVKPRPGLPIGKEIVMSSTTLYRLSGLALLIALPIQIVGWILHPAGEHLSDLLNPLQGPAHVVMFCSWLLVLLGLPGLYVRQAHRAGWLGLASFVLVMFAVAYHFYLLLYEAYPAPMLARNPATQALIVTDGPLAHGAGALGLVGFVLIIVAFPLFGIATVRAGVFPRWAGWLQIASIPVFFVSMIGLSLILSPDVVDRLPGPLSPIAMQYYLLFLGYAWGGYALWIGKQRTHAATTQLGEPQPAV
jgi:hypothetical protein